jgi:hypothetical protein
MAPPVNPNDLELGDRRGNKDYFWYGPALFTMSSVLTPVTNNIQIDADANFMWIASTYQIDIAGALLTESTNIIPLVSLLINDTGSGKNLMNVAVPLASIAGDGKRPYRLPRPRVFGANATIQLNWTAFVVAGTTYNIRFTMHGFKVYV